jgi:hypothetical protein
VFWFIIALPAVLVLLWVLITVVIPLLFFGAVGTAQGALDRKFEKEYLTGPVSDRKVQRKMRMTFWISRAMAVFGILIAITPIAIIIQSGEMYLSDLPLFLLVGVLGLGICIAGFVMMQRGKQLAGLIAAPIIREMLGADSEFDASGHIPDECIAASGFAADYERVEGSDFARGTYRGISVMFSDVRLTRTERQYDHKSKKYKEHVIELFKGYWLVADFDRSLAAVPLTVLEKRARGNRGHSIQMESEAFNRQFSVFCADAHTAFYILTPHFMERLAAVDAAADGSSRFKFDENRLQIAVGTKRDLFETGAFKVPNVEAMRARFREDVGRLTGVLDEMLAHERLFGSDAERQEPSAEQGVSHE